jgi:hypothetical protein
MLFYELVSTITNAKFRGNKYANLAYADPADTLDWLLLTLKEDEDWERKREREMADYYYRHGMY